MFALSDGGGEAAAEGPGEAEAGPQQAAAPPGGLAVEGGVSSLTLTSLSCLAVNTVFHNQMFCYFPVKKSPSTSS